MSTTLKWGLITGMVYIIFSLLNNMLGVQPGGSNQSLSLLMSFLLMVVTFFTLFLGVKETREDLDGYLTFGQGFKSGMGIALIASVIAAIFTLIYMKFIDPEMGDKIMEGVEEQWEKAGMAEEQRDMARKWTSYMFNPVIMTLFMLVYVNFWGLIKSLVAAAILKKDAPPTVPTV